MVHHQHFGFLATSLAADAICLVSMYAGSCLLLLGRYSAGLILQNAGQLAYARLKCTAGEFELDYALPVLDDVGCYGCQGQVCRSPARLQRLRLTSVM